MRQKNQVELNLGTGAKGEAPSAAARESEARTAKACLERPAVAEPSMEVVVERENLKEALAQVKRNKGVAGVRRLRVDAPPPYLHGQSPRAPPLLPSHPSPPQPPPGAAAPPAAGRVPL